MKISTSMRESNDNYTAMAILYLTEQGSTLKKEGNRLIVEKDDSKLLDVPLINIDAVLVYGNIQLTTQAISLLFEHGIETAFLTMTGELKGQLTPRKSKNNLLRMAQYRCAHDAAITLLLAKTIVGAKIQNQMYLMKQFVYKYPEVNFSAEFRLIQEALQAIERKQAVGNLLGAEGNAGATYFRSLRSMFIAEIKFNGRNRRPPQDEANALLSFGYSLILNELTSLLDAVGFDPYIGFLHGIDYGRPSLALDLLEEFRQPVVDRFVLTLCNKRILQKSDFEQRDGGFYLTKNGLKAFFTAYEAWMNKPRKEAGSFREIIRQQVYQLSKTLQQGKPYAPLTMENL